MLAQTNGDDSFDPTTQANKDSYVNSNGDIIHNMYDLDNFWFHQQAARRHKYPYALEYDYQHIYRRPADASETNATNQNSITSITKADNTFYAIDKLSCGGHCFINDEMYKWLLNDNGFVAPPSKNIATMLYYVGTLSNDTQIKNDISKASKYYTQQQLSSYGVHATSAIVGVKYNTIYEIPGSIKQDYTKGELVANTFKAKNQFDAEWNMAHFKSEVEDIRLSAARSYDGIYCCGSTVWLKYRNSINYQISSSSNVQTTPDFHTKINVSAKDRIVPKLPEVEVITAINRGVESPQHKSTLYSLKLKSLAFQKLLPAEALKYEENAVIRDRNTVTQQTVVTGINSNAVAKIKSILKLEIQNQMRKIAESIQPANCQLFSSTLY